MWRDPNDDPSWVNDVANEMGSGEWKDTKQGVTSLGKIVERRL